MDTKPARYSIPREFVEEGLRKIYPGSRIDDLISISTGFTNSIFSFTREGIPLIIRMPPRTTPRLAYEAELMKALYGKGLPVPTVVEYNPSYENPLGHPFLIMEKLKGKTLLEAIDTGEIQPTPKLVVEIATALRRVHTAETSDLNVPKFSTLQSYLDQGLVGIKQLAKLANFRCFEKFEEWFQKNRPAETSLNRSFIHNDFHVANIMVDGDSLSGILDWNDAVVAEAQVDVAMFSLLADALGYPAFADAFITEYRRISHLPIPEIRFYITAIALQKLIQIPLQKKQMEQTGQPDKAQVLSLVISRVEKNFTRIIEENTGLPVNNAE